MACKLTVNSAIRAPLLWQSRLLQPSLLQGAISVRTIYGLRRLNANQPKFPLALCSRSYSTPPRPPPKELIVFTESSQSFKHWFIKAKEQIRKRWKTFTFIILGAGYVIINSIRDHWLQDVYKWLSRRKYELVRDSAIYNKLKEGPKFETSIENIIEREKLVNRVRSEITPTAGPRNYPVIIGDHGTGKSSLIQLAVESLEAPKGVVYLDVSDKTGDIAEDMKLTLDWNPIDPSEKLSFGEFWDLLIHAAHKYKKEYKKIPVLIIDHANRLPWTLLRRIQDNAANSAVNGPVTIVFVSSEGCIPLAMMRRSEWFRHGKIIEVGDVSKDEALQYLEYRNLDTERAKEVFKLVGGRVAHLKAAANDIMDGNCTLEEVRLNMCQDVREQLGAAGMLPHGHHYKGAMVIKKLLKNGPISYDEYYKLTGEIGKELLRENVLTHHRGSDMVTFQSTLMARFWEGKWGKQKNIS